MTPASGQEKRKQKRIKNRCEVEYSAGNLTYKGMSSNFSQDGLYIATRKPFVPDTVISIVIYLPDGSTAKLVGRVSRALKTRFGGTFKPSGTSFKERDGMGVQIIENDPKYNTFVSGLLAGL